MKRLVWAKFLCLSSCCTKVGVLSDDWFKQNKIKKEKFACLCKCMAVCGALLICTLFLIHFFCLIFSFFFVKERGHRNNGLVICCDVLLLTSIAIATFCFCCLMHIWNTKKPKNLLIKMSTPALLSDFCLWRIIAWIWVLLALKSTQGLLCTHLVSVKGLFMCDHYIGLCYLTSFLCHTSVIEILTNWCWKAPTDFCKLLHISAKWFHMSLFSVY